MSSTCAGIWLNDFMTENTDSFLYCRLPGEETFTRYDFTSADEGRLNFGPASVSPWPGTQMTDMQVRPQSTPQDEYLDCIKTLSDELGRTGGKVVICRQICGRGSVRDILDGAERYFGRFPDMFCFIFYHPVTKWWMGASPELLLESETPTQAATRALAGTRQAGTAEAWSEKNMAEHQFVVDRTSVYPNLASHAGPHAFRPDNRSHTSHTGCVRISPHGGCRHDCGIRDVAPELLWRLYFGAVAARSGGICHPAMHTFR